MAEGLAIFGGVSAAWSLAKDVRSFVKKLKRAGCDVKDLDLRFNDDVRRLHHCKMVLLSFEDRLPEIDAKHLRQLARKIKRVVAQLKGNLDRYFRGCQWSRLIWATHGNSISKAEEDLSFWITRLRAAITDYGLFDLSNLSSDKTLRSDESQASETSTSRTLVTRTNGHSSRYGKVIKNDVVDIHAMRDEIQAAMLSTGGAPSISYHAITSIIAKFGLRSIIQNDKSLSAPWSTLQGPFDLENFASSVEENAQVLLGISIHVNLDLSFLRELIACGFSDKDLPLSTSILRQCGLWSQTKIDSFGRWQHAFAPRQQLEDSNRYEQRILLRGNDTSQSARLPFIDSNSTLLGQGSCGKVYKVTMDSQVYAMKVFHAAGYYQQEVDMLRELSEYPHPNIAPHFASWVDKNGQYRILFPAAEMNLRQMMDQKTPDIRRSWTTAQLLQQFSGLAHAVNHIHTSRQICHHDIKPSNILYMEERIDPQEKTTIPRLVLSDFGSASFASHDTEPGTRVYGAPEASLTRRIKGSPDSRPYDIWALGCVFLEVLSFLFPLANSPDSRPLRARLKDGMPFTNCQQDAFWYEDLNGEIRLRPSVTAAIGMVSENLPHGRKLLPAIDLVRRSLEIDPSKRINAKQLAARLQTIVQSEANDSLTDHTDHHHSTPPETSPIVPYISTPPLQSHPPFKRSFWLPWRRKARKRERVSSYSPKRQSVGEDLRDHTESSISCTSAHTTRRERQQLWMLSSDHSWPGPRDHDLTGSSTGSRMTRRRRKHLLAQQGTR